MKPVPMFVVLLALALVFYTGYSFRSYVQHRQQPACVDVHQSGIAAAKAALDGKRVCEGTR